MDHWSLPDGAAAFLNSNSNSINDGTRIGNFYENRCRSKIFYSFFFEYLGRPQSWLIFILIHSEEASVTRNL